MSDAWRPARVRLIVLIGLLVGAAFGGEELAFRIRLSRSLAGLEPDPYFLEYVKGNPDRLDRTLVTFWEKGSLAHRQAALHLIKFPGTPEQRFSPVARFERYLLEGADSRDLAVRIPALQLLTQHGHPRWCEYVAGQLQDPDPHLRVLAMRLFRQRGVTNVLPLVAAQLDHPDRYLTCNAVIWLQNATGIDHGMKSWWISRLVLLTDDERAANLARFRQSLTAAREWWSRAKDMYPPYEGPLRKPLAAAPVPVSRPDLVGFAGKPFALGPDRGLPTLYYFFTVWKASPFSEAADLNALHEMAAGRVRIIGVALDAIPDEHNENQHADLIPGRDDAPVTGWGGHGHHDHDHDGHDHGPVLRFDVISNRVQERVALQGYRFPVAFDRSGDFVAELQAGDVPCFALVDAQHRLVRRYARGRSPHAVLAMLDDEAKR